MMYIYILIFFVCPMISYSILCLWSVWVMYACLVELPKNKSPQPLSAIDCLKEISIWKLLDVQKKILDFFIQPC